MNSEASRSLRRFVAYATIAFVPIFGLAVVLTRTTAIASQQDAVAAALLQAQTINRSALRPFVDELGSNQTLSPTVREGLKAATTALVDNTTVFRLRLRDISGRVVFDALHPNALPGQPDLNEDIAVVLAGGIVAGRAQFGADAVDGGRPVGVDAIEVYLPIVSSSAPFRVVGVLELYVPYAPIAAAHAATLRQTYIVLLGGLLVLWLVVAAILWSVTSRVHRQSDANKYLSLHDPLTGMPNRALFADRVEHAINANARTGLPVSIAIVDLDRFKEVNDTLGHANGDILLNCVAQRMMQELRPGDTAARLGGDEFGLVLPGVGAQAARSILDRIQLVIGRELELDGIPVTPNASIGWAEWPEQGNDVDHLMRRADLALYAAKDAGMGVVRYAYELQPADVSSLGLVAELRHAVAKNEFELLYQPKVEINTGQLVGFEALVRWRHPERGLLAPSDFMNVLETTALIGSLTRWVFDTAMGQLVDWGEAASGLSMSVNVSVRNVRDPSMASWFEQRLVALELDPARVIIEITETAIATDPRRVMEHIAQLDAAGINVSLDDFGQGYTSLSQLSTLRVSELKIDREFTSLTHSSLKAVNIVAAAIELGHRLGLNVVAEGVESAESLEALRDLGCDEAQGYLFAGPLSEPDARALLAGVGWVSAVPTR